METLNENSGSEISRANKHFTLLSLFNDSFCKHCQKDDLTLWHDQINSSVIKQVLPHIKWINKFKYITIIKSLEK